MDHTNKEWLTYHYLTLKESPYRIAELVGRKAPTIVYWLNKFEIPIRNRSEANKFRPPMREETKKKLPMLQGDFWRGRKRSDENKKKLSDVLKGREFTPEWKKKIAETRKRKGISKGENNPMYGIPSPMKGKHQPEEVRRRMSEGKRGEKNPMYGMRREKCPTWKGGKSFEPYCPAFNHSKKEEVRERFNRTCFVCGEQENGRKLHVHHVDYNKLQGCKGKQWALLPLCLRCHTRTTNSRHHYFNLLINYWSMNTDIHFYEVNGIESQTAGFFDSFGR